LFKDWLKSDAIGFEGRGLKIDPGPILGIDKGKHAKHIGVKPCLPLEGQIRPLMGDSDG
jgi:hypothetical protein